eukprot:2146336-Prymnesium_polylepis.1
MATEISGRYLLQLLQCSTASYSSMYFLASSLDAGDLVAIASSHACFSVSSAGVTCVSPNVAVGKSLDHQVVAFIDTTLRLCLLRYISLTRLAPRK